MWELKKVAGLVCSYTPVDGGKGGCLFGTKPVHSIWFEEKSGCRIGNKDKDDTSNMMA